MCGLLVFAIVVTAQLGVADCHDGHDDHHHHHHDESPAFKYSQAANKPPSSDEAYTDAHGAPHSHGSHHHASHSHASHSHASHSHGSHSHSSATKPKKARSFEETAYIWARALGSTLLVSVAPFLILFFIPIDGRSGHESLLKVLLSFASGGLLGDAFLHLIPHALMPHGEDTHHHDHHHHDDSGHAHGPHDMSVGLWVLAGILAFLMVEKFVRMMKGGHSHSHSHEGEEKPTGKCDGESSGAEDKSNLVQRKKSHKKDEVQKHDNEAPSDIKVAAYLNLAADFTHNFTDGLAIGASYVAGNTAGFISTLTILLHEVPHEIGDFAILVQSGYSKRKAMCMQLVTAAGCLSGTLCSLVAEGMSSSTSSWVLPFTAGGFIYIATVSVIPELLENTKLWQSVKEVLALLVGVSMMALLTQFE